MSTESISTKGTSRAKTITGILLLFGGLFLLLSFVSHLLNWQTDQSQLFALLDKEVLAENLLGKVGGLLGHLFIFLGFGIAVFVLPLYMLGLGMKFLFTWRFPWAKVLYHSILLTLFLPLLLGLIFPSKPWLFGRMGFEMKDFLGSLIGTIGIVILLISLLLLYLFLEWQLSPQHLLSKIKSTITKEENPENPLDDEEEREQQDLSPSDEKPHQTTFKQSQPEIIDFENIHFSDESDKEEDESKRPTGVDNFQFEVAKAEEPVAMPAESDLGLDLEVTPVAKEEHLDENRADDLVSKYGSFDPRLELSNFQFPSLDLLQKYEQENNLSINQKELEENKDKIVKTLSHYGIGIEHIKATIGPTITLYEIVPEAGVRISKIKNLEDDIALSLSALGIRIIAPMPGKGTIGIEVPNSKTSMVSMHSVLSSAKFQESKMELPIAFGKTISNETFVADLAKMPHLLMAGATGQGKSVGLNAIVTSLLYKRHPAELKFVMVDPKKVELTLYSKIERHYLAKLPEAEEAIITDNSTVITTLNSLCIEMDHRYELLKSAFVRNIKEYNEKFKSRKLNPENGHKFLPYIVLIIDEFADLIMTAGKEVEMPIARLAQLARAVGIHLIVATQRPSVNVITGIIKANFPARVAFRVTSKIDSRTILDSAGADQLIGKGDMLLTLGGDLVRLQCAFVDTPEVNRLTEFIGEQRAYPHAHELPEVETSEGGSVNLDDEELDGLFEEAARVIVNAQQGSTSLIQRKLKLGYNRAGRIIDQLEAAGVVGPFEGSKARQVLIPDELSLEQFLKNLQNK